MEFFESLRSNILYIPCLRSLGSSRAGWPVSSADWQQHCRGWDVKSVAPDPIIAPEPPCCLSSTNTSSCCKIHDGSFIRGKNPSRAQTNFVLATALQTEGPCWYYSEESDKNWNTSHQLCNYHPQHWANRCFTFRNNFILILIPRPLQPGPGQTNILSQYLAPETTHWFMTKSQQFCPFARGCQPHQSYAQNSSSKYVTLNCFINKAEQSSRYFTVHLL